MKLLFDEKTENQPSAIPQEGSTCGGGRRARRAAFRAMMWAEESVDLNERIVVDPGILVGKPVIRGTRLAVEFIIELLAGGWSEEQILANYPGITAQDVRACLEYARHVLEQERAYPVSGG